MTQQHPITPPSELVYEWAEDRELLRDPLPLPEYIANCAAQWGADTELEACCEYLVRCAQWEPEDVDELRAARRPKAPSLKEQALIHFESFAATFETSGGDSDLIRRALEQLDD